MKGVIKVFGSNIPTLPLVKLLSRLPMMITYQFDYSEQTRKNTLTGLRYWLAPLLERLAISPADLVLVTTGWLEDKIQRVYYKKTVLLPNWVDLGTLQQTCGNKTRNEKMILYAGRLHWSKGVSILLYAFSQVKRRHPEALLVICGEGEQRRSLEELVKSLGTNGVEFRGSLPNDEVLQLMSRAAICVLPTLTMEGHPKVLIEAMACGAACVATDVPGNREVLADGQTGIIVPPSDVEALSNILQLLLSDYSLRDRLGRSAQVEALRYNFSTIVSQEMQVLSALSGAVSGANVG
jgi:glycosyltransferase involved in cell wall biosynthesis